MLTSEKQEQIRKAYNLYAIHSGEKFSARNQRFLNQIMAHIKANSPIPDVKKLKKLYDPSAECYRTIKDVLATSDS